VTHEAVTIKPKFQRRPQEVGDARNVECLLRKTTGMSRASTGESPLGLQGHGGGAAEAFGLTSWMPDMEQHG
jgi:hypothetical protein